MKVWVISSQYDEHEYGYGGWTGNVYPVVTVEDVCLSEEKAISRLAELKEIDNEKHYSFETFETYE